MTALDREPYVSLVTYRRDGTPVQTPVWFAELDGKLYVFTDGTSYKVKRLRRDPRVRVAVCGVAGAVRGEWLDGRGRIVEEQDLVQRAYAALDAKYGWQKKLLDLGSWLGGRIDRRAMIEVTLG